MCSGGPILTIQKSSLGKEIILGPRGCGRDLSETRGGFTNCPRADKSPIYKRGPHRKIEKRAWSSTPNLSGALGRFGREAAKAGFENPGPSLGAEGGVGSEQPDFKRKREFRFLV